MVGIEGVLRGAGALEVRLAGVLGGPQKGVQRIAGGRLAVGVEILVRRQFSGADAIGRLRDRELDQLVRHQATAPASVRAIIT
jgi:hypothetical protein